VTVESSAEGDLEDSSLVVKNYRCSSQKSNIALVFPEHLKFFGKPLNSIFPKQKKGKKKNRKRIDGDFGKI
jgi:hypothetical protein